MKHCLIYASREGMKPSIIDCEAGTNTEQIILGLIKVGFTKITEKKGFPVRCPACKVIVDVADYPDSSRFCAVCAPKYLATELAYAHKLTF